MMVDNSLESRVRKLEKAISAFAQELHLALQYIQSDAASSLTKSRIVMERLLVQIYMSEMGHTPRKPLLGEMLADNQFTRKIERRMLSRMNSIRDLANLGPHGELVKPTDAAKVLDDLCEVVEWFLLRYTKQEPLGHKGEQAEQPAEGARQSEPERPPELPLHILLIEEGSVNLVLATRVLEKHGCTVVPTGSAKAALTVAANEPFDLILTQAQIGEMDGPAIAAAIRQQVSGTGGQPPMLVMTTDEHCRRRCLEAGMDGCVSRPIQAPELIAAIQSLFPVEQLLKVVDWSHVLKNSGGDKEVLQEIVTAFLQEHEQGLIDLYEGVAQKNAAQLQRRAHCFKGVFNFFGVQAARDTAERLEAIARRATSESDVWSDAEGECETLKRESRRVYQAIRLYLKGIAAPGGRPT
jgi:CheY-like chemotaxis protein/HPt (histidine-containing phosphotransfer) domain-containing protein